jgi:transcription elongation GreA/GreB family factor
MSATHAIQGGRNIQIQTKNRSSVRSKSKLQRNSKASVNRGPLFANKSMASKRSNKLLKVAGIGDVVYLRYGTEVQFYELLADNSTSHAKQGLPVGSPLARAIIGKAVGDTVLVETNYGHFQFVISHID